RRSTPARCRSRGARARTTPTCPSSSRSRCPRRATRSSTSPPAPPGARDVPRIGDFTSAPPPEDADPLTFTLDKVEFTVAAKASGFALGDLVEVIDSGDIDTPRGNRAIVNAMVEALVDEDRAKFRRHCERHRTTAGELWPILTAMAE